MATYRGRYNDGASARTVETEIMVSAAGLAINDATGTAIDTWPAADVALVDRPQAGLPLRLGRLGNPQVRLIIQDRAALAELSAHCPNLRRRVRLDGRSAVRLGALLVAAALSVAALVHFVIPEIATQVARSMPPQLERRIGEGVADQLALLMGAIEGRRRALACAAPSGVAALEALLARLAPARQSAEGREGASDPGPDLPPTVRVLDARLVNAFALPGAVIVLPRGMIDFSRSPDELAGVLAHELGHIALRHPIETLIKVAGVSTLFSLLIGDVTGGAVIVALGEYMIRVSYTRPVEQAADAYAVAALHRAAIDPAATAAAFARLLPKGAAGGALERALSTHPPTEDRVALFRAAAREGRPALSAGEWAALKAICAEKAQSRANG